MRSKTSDGMLGFKRWETRLKALDALAVLAILGCGANRASAALVVSGGAGAGGSGGGAMAPMTLLALLALLIVGWWRTRSALVISAQEPESDSGDQLSRWRSKSPQ
jgi:hypothetical protein